MEGEREKKEKSQQKSIEKRGKAGKGTKDGNRKTNIDMERERDKG